ncbi:hypothetical protein MKI84_03160 [Ancylobacter sp. A5.8]|uniref:hypothetical protein n=1 Tax=Ancylobacter gelatini TaxID=2919920 RepID=UPI001F4E6E8E|nr:hypothetical protein [Ancylobacter gelatini]MCJ8141905.1 hypothetical protein [Ancylobacter gelatini]
MRNDEMFRGQLPRIYELSDLIATPAPAGAYFHNLNASLAAIPQKLKQYRDIEAELQVLDYDAWACLKAKVEPDLKRKDALRAWEQAFNTLNEAKGYKYLVSAGYSDIRFIPVSGQSTPDLEAFEGSRRILCEVKTINRSDQQRETFARNEVFDVVDQLDEGFFTKLECSLNNAAKQMRAYCSEADTRRIAYVIINLDDILHEYADRYRVQLESFLVSKKPSDIEVVWDIKPPFYTSQL